MSPKNIHKEVLARNDPNELDASETYNIKEKKILIILSNKLVQQQKHNKCLNREFGSYLSTASYNRSRVNVHAWHMWKSPLHGSVLASPLQ